MPRLRAGGGRASPPSRPHQEDVDKLGRRSGYVKREGRGSGKDRRKALPSEDFGARGRHSPLKDSCVEARQ